ncbi:MAG TPA: HEAT repeat domain-containing protein [Planctomycetaceae bacterium]|nr:HEAT repeat domain-containing protein [Planctomycetaceae bacterium]
MKWLKVCGALLAAMSMNSLADAGLLGSLRGDCGGAKGCGCAATCQPQCCKPVIVKPCCPNVYTYQRKCSDIKPPCCDTCCPPATCCAPAACAPACAAPAATCAPAPAACAPAPAACAPAPAACAPACAAPAACAPAPAACAPACAAPAACAPACAAPTACAPACAAPVCCNNSKKLGGGLLGRLFNNKGKKNDCGAPTACTPEVRCCNADPCEVATLIYESQTACKGKDRQKAIRKLGNKFDCICNPEIMTAFIVGLNDADEGVRKEAADEIGDQIRKNCCCCPEVVAALTCALGDCDKHVVKQAVEALEACGYEVVDGCCNPCGQATACGTGCAPAAGSYAPAPAAPGVPAAPAPVPPQDSQARRGALSNLLGLLD